MPYEPGLSGKPGKGVRIVDFVFGIVVQEKDVKNRPHSGNEHPMAKLLHPTDGSILPDHPVIDEIQLAPAAGNLLPNVPFHLFPVFRMDQGNKRPPCQFQEVIKRRTAKHGQKPGIGIEDFFPLVVPVNQNSSRQMVRHLLEEKIQSLFCCHGYHRSSGTGYSPSGRTQKYSMAPRVSSPLNRGSVWTITGIRRPVRSFRNTGCCRDCPS